MFRKRTKPLLWVGFGGLLLLLGVLGISAISFLDLINRRHEHIRQEFVARNRALETLRSDLYLSGTYIRDYLADLNAAGKTQQKYDQTKQHIQHEVSLYGQSVRPEETESFRLLNDEVQSYLQTLDSVFGWSPRERLARGDAFIQNQVLPKRMAMVTLAGQIEHLNEKRMEASSRETSELFSQFQVKLLSLVAVMLGLGGLLAGISLWRILQLEQESEARFAEVARARRELQELSARLLEAQESERRRIARELHDEVGQALWAMSLGIDNLGSALKRGDTEDALRQLAGIREISDNSVRVVRNMSLLLRPSMLDDLGLLPALKWLAREVSRTSELQVDVTAEELPDDLPEEYKTCVYRVAQEALRNCSRHANARHARIYVRTAPEKLLLSVQDDGVGFDPRRDKGLGLLGMEERVKRLDGLFQVDSKPGLGTLIGLQLPMPRDAPRDTALHQEMSPFRTP